MGGCCSTASPNSVRTSVAHPQRPHLYGKNYMLAKTFAGWYNHTLMRREEKAAAAAINEKLREKEAQIAEQKKNPGPRKNRYRASIFGMAGAAEAKLINFRVAMKRGDRKQSRKLSKAPHLLPAADDEAPPERKSFGSGGFVRRPSRNPFGRAKSAPRGPLGQFASPRESPRAGARTSIRWRSRGAPKPMSGAMRRISLASRALFGNLDELKKDLGTVKEEDEDEEGDEVPPLRSAASAPALGASTSVPAAATVLALDKVREPGERAGSVFGLETPKTVGEFFGGLSKRLGLQQISEEESEDNTAGAAAAEIRGAAADWHARKKDEQAAGAGVGASQASLDA